MSISQVFSENINYFIFIAVLAFIWILVYSFFKLNKLTVVLAKIKLLVILELIWSFFCFITPLIVKLAWKEKVLMPILLFLSFKLKVILDFFLFLFQTVDNKGIELYLAGIFIMFIWYGILSLLYQLYILIFTRKAKR